MLLNTTSLGEIEYKEEDVIKFVNAIPGFKGLNEFVFVDMEEESLPFRWLQSTQDTSVTFVVVNPILVKHDYDINISDEIVNKLEIEKPEDVEVYSILTIPENVNQMTANLRAPIIINITNNKAKQVILENEKYKIKHRITEDTNTSDGEA